MTALLRQGVPLGIIFLATMAIVVVLGRRGTGMPAARVALFVLAAAWLGLFLLKFREIPLSMGSDARGHISYVRFFAANGRLPLATDGWSTYHPPLFYLLGWGVTSLGERLASVPFSLSLKLIPFLSGFGIACASAALARRVVPDDRRTVFLAALFAGLLPMNLYVSAYPSNEGLHAFLSAMCILWAVDALLCDAPGSKRIVSLSVLLGLALLTKFTAVVIAVISCAFVGSKIVASNRHHPRVLLRRMAALLIPMFVISGWYYVRNVAEFGRPLVGNWDLPGPGRTWWSQPGFHTMGYYLDFGEALVRPYRASFVSFWDGIYSTLWGDGMLGARTFRKRPNWNYDFMSAGYLLALPATLFIAVGLAGACRRVFGDPRASRRAVFQYLTVYLGAMWFSVLYLTLSLPYFGQSKSYYALNTTPVLALLFAMGVGRMDTWLSSRGWLVARAFLAGWVGTLFGCFYLAFAI